MSAPTRNEQRGIYVPEEGDGWIGWTVMSLGRLAENAVARSNLSILQYRLLGYLRGGGRVQADLAFQLAVTKQKATRVVDTMVARGLVRRRPDPEDRRRVIHTLTKKGERLHDKATTLIAEGFARTVLSDLKESDRDLVLTGLRCTTESIRENFNKIPDLSSDPDFVRAYAKVTEVEQ